MQPGAHLSRRASAERDTFVTIVDVAASLQESAMMNDDSELNAGDRIRSRSIAHARTTVCFVLVVDCS
jgi:hypothetical protein